MKFMNKVLSRNKNANARQRSEQCESAADR